MKKDFVTNLTGSLFIAAYLMLWGGWMLMPSHIGGFFQAEISTQSEFDDGYGYRYNYDFEH